jgi:hypothetical protein
MAALRKVPYFESWSFSKNCTRVWWPNRETFRVHYADSDTQRRIPIILMESLRTEPNVGSYRVTWLFLGRRIIRDDLSISADGRRPPGGVEMIFDSHAVLPSLAETLRARDLLNLLGIYTSGPVPGLDSAALRMKQWLVLNREGISQEQDVSHDATADVLKKQKTTVPPLPEKLETLDPTKATIYYSQFSIPTFPAPPPSKHPIACMLSERAYADMKAAAEEKRALSIATRKPHARGAERKRRVPTAPTAPTTSTSSEPTPMLTSSPTKRPRPAQFSTTTKFLSLPQQPPPTTRQQQQQQQQQPPNLDWIDTMFDNIDDDGEATNTDA